METNRKKLRSGFTTGSCAAAAAKAALYMLLTGKVRTEITIVTPAGIPFKAEITDIERKEDKVSCAVIKDGGDDPDVTTGCHITAAVSMIRNEESLSAKEHEREEISGSETKRNRNDIGDSEAGHTEDKASLKVSVPYVQRSGSCSTDECAPEEGKTTEKTGRKAAGKIKENTGAEGASISAGAKESSTTAHVEDHLQRKEKSSAPRPFVILIDGGEGVGRVTKPGLDQPEGEAAINHVPRQMIRNEAEDVLKSLGLMDDDRNTVPGEEYCGVHIVICVPGGEKVAEKTFNPGLGIKGGISILGTSGIVEPMSEQALKDTILVELRQKMALGYPVAPVSPGNYGLEFMKRTYGYDLDRSVKCSNFIGDTIDMAADLGFKELLLTGHIGKLVKVSGGILNTHSKVADCRMELLCAAALLAGCSGDTARKILPCVSTEEAVRILKEEGPYDETMRILMERIMRVLERKADGRLRIGCILYSNEHGLLAKSDLADAMLEKLIRMQEGG